MTDAVINATNNANSGATTTTSAPNTNSTPVKNEVSVKSDAAKPVASLREAHEAARKDIQAKSDKVAAALKSADGEDKVRGADMASGADAGDVTGNSSSGKAETGAADAGHLEAPVRWPAERKEFFARQPKDVQEQILAIGKDWETGYNRKFEELAHQRKLAEGVSSLFTPELRQQAREAGLDEVGTVRQLLDMQQRYMRDPVAYIRGLIQHSRIDPNVLFTGQSTQQGNATAQHPLHQVIEPMLQPIAAQLNEIREFKTTLEQERKQQHDKQVDQTMNSFVSAKDSAGNFAHPYVERVADDMISILRNDPRVKAIGSLEQRLEFAYNAAVYANPDIRSEILRAEAAKQTTAIAKTEDTTRTVEAASIKPANSSGGTRNKSINSLRDAHQAALREMKVTR